MLDIQIDDDYRQDPISFLTYYALFALAGGCTVVWARLMLRNKSYLARAHILMLAYSVAYTFYLLLLGIVHSPGANPEKDSLIISFVVLDLADGTLSNVTLAALFVGWSLPQPILSKQEKAMVFIPWVTFISCSFVTYICFLIESTATFASYNSPGWVSVTFVHNAAIMGAIISLLVFCNVLCVTRRRVEESSNQARKVVLQLPRMWALYVVASTLAQMVTGYGPAWSTALGKHGVRLAFNWKVGSLLYPAPYLVYTELAPEGVDMPTLADEEEGTQAAPRPLAGPARGPAGGRAGRWLHRRRSRSHPPQPLAGEAEAAWPDAAASRPPPPRRRRRIPGERPPPCRLRATRRTRGARRQSRGSDGGGGDDGGGRAGWGDDEAEDGDEGDWGGWNASAQPASPAPGAGAPSPPAADISQLKRVAGKKD
eukprot:tig00021108_g18330.t1